ncbi:MAG: ribonuclease H-like domain-containing protein [Bacteroidia bacterium]|nr:ribonuclease H-like domain-containing protein [Bacteroidia bacterium]
MIQKILFLDIETVPIKYRYSELSEKERKLWDAKWKYNPEIDPEAQYSKAGIYSEFAKVICIGLGYVDKNGQIQVKALSNDNEKELLSEFNQVLYKFYQHVFKTYNVEYNLCAHNGREFDFPFLCRRMLINGISVPDILKHSRRDVLLDTMDMWKFGDFKNYTSLDLLAYVFGLDSPKEELDGSMIAKVYYEDNNMDKIESYCKKDVVTLIEVYKKLNEIK